MKHDGSPQSKHHKLKRLAELEEIARKLTQTTLANYDIPEDIRQNLILGTIFDGDFRVFQLYVPGDKPEDAQVISRVRVNAFTGDASIDVFLTRRENSTGL
ncbi:MAG: hypothetical protein MRJ68_06240 [Nitrospira sp.]|nr:hypothetical protein [Nitrospira sp.]